MDKNVSLGDRVVVVAAETPVLPRGLTFEVYESSSRVVVNSPTSLDARALGYDEPRGLRAFLRKGDAVRVGGVVHTVREVNRLDFQLECKWVLKSCRAVVVTRAAHADVRLPGGFELKTGSAVCYASLPLDELKAHVARSANAGDMATLEPSHDVRINGFVCTIASLEPYQDKTFQQADRSSRGSRDTHASRRNRNLGETRHGARADSLDLDDEPGTPGTPLHSERAPLSAKHGESASAKKQTMMKKKKKKRSAPRRTRVTLTTAWAGADDHAAIVTLLGEPPGHDALRLPHNQGATVVGVSRDGLALATDLCLPPGGAGALADLRVFRVRDYVEVTRSSPDSHGGHTWSISLSTLRPFGEPFPACLVAHGDGLKGQGRSISIDTAKRAYDARVTQDRLDDRVELDYYDYAEVVLPA
jgi:hypothetical protein